MRCSSKEKDNSGNPCQETAVRQCRHDFATCRKHFHGCKNEEDGVIK